MQHRDRDPYVGRTFGNYRLQSRIASGTFGYVYLAEHDWLPCNAAIKILKPEYLQSPRERKRFQREALYLYELRHPYILNINDFGEDHGMLYMVTEYASKGSLLDRLAARASHRLPLQSALSILTQVGEALHYVNQHHILHRDLKPGNILFTSANEPRLADFGIAIVQARPISGPETAIRGTPEYMAPEQFMGKNEQKSDQYSLGCMAYQLLTGHLPFIAPNNMALGFKHLSEEPIPLRGLNPLIPAHIEYAVLKAMSKNCADRYESVFGFVRALQQK